MESFADFTGRGWKRWVTLVFRVGLAGILLAAGIPKILDSESNVRAVRAYQIVPESLVRPIAYGQPAFEIALALLLLFGLATRLTALVTGVLFLLYIAAIISVWSRGLSIDCGCFSKGGAITGDPVPGYIKDLFRDTIFALMAAWVVRWPRSPWSLDGLFTQPHVTNESADEDRIMDYPPSEMHK